MFHVAWPVPQLVPTCTRPVNTPSLYGSTVIDVQPAVSPYVSMSVWGSGANGKATYRTPGVSNVVMNDSMFGAAAIVGSAAPDSSADGAVSTSVHVGGTDTVMRPVSSTSVTNPGGSVGGAVADADTGTSATGTATVIAASSHRRVVERFLDIGPRSLLPSRLTPRWRPSADGRESNSA